MVIGTNMSALNDASLLQRSSQLLSQSLTRLSSGSQIISPADDAAGLGETMRLGGEQLRNQAASNNLSDAMSFQQTQDGYLQNITNALDRMSELAIQSQDVTKSNSDRALYNQEYQTLASYVGSVQSADFNGVSLFSGNALNVTDDQAGDTFALAGISANYLSGATVTTTTSSTSNVSYASSATLGQVLPTFSADNPDGDILEAFGNLSTTSITPSSTISDLVGFFNSSYGNGSASYDSTTGQLSITIPPVNDVQDNNFDDSPAGGVLSELGMTPNFSGPGANVYGPQTFTTTLTHPVTTTTSTTSVISSAGDINTISDAGSALTNIQNAISAVASDRANIGAGMQRIEYNVSQLGTLNNNLAAASSRISDVDVAEESTVYARENILVQTGTAMLAQANSQPESVLRLLS